MNGLNAGRCRQANRNFSAFIGIAVNNYRSIIQFNKFLAKNQAQTSALFA
jgi:hypothetical protein